MTDLRMELSRSPAHWRRHRMPPLSKIGFYFYCPTHIDRSPEIVRFRTDDFTGLLATICDRRLASSGARASHRAVCYLFYRVAPPQDCNPRTPAQRKSPHPSIPLNDLARAEQLHRPLQLCKKQLAMAGRMSRRLRCHKQL